MRPAGERWARVKELFEAAVDLDPNERTALLEKECGGDEVLRAEIESLLKSDERTDGFIEQPAFEIPRDLFSEAEQEPERPGTAIAKGVGNSKNHIPKPKSLRGDLDNIVLMAMRKEPSRRYASVGQFSEDIRRHLAGLPVVARKDTVTYRTSKFFNRHRIGVAAAALVLLSLVGGIVATFWQAHRATQQRDRAERRFADVRKLSNALLFDIAPKIERLEGSTEARKSLVQRALEYLDSLANESAENAPLQSELAAAYEKVGELQGAPRKPNLNDFSGAIASYEKARDIRKRLLEKHPDDRKDLGRLAADLSALSSIRLWISDTSGSLEDSQAALAAYEKLLKEQPGSHELQLAAADSEVNLANSYYFNDQLAQVYPPLNRALAALEALGQHDPDNPEILRLLGRGHTTLSLTLSWDGKQKEGEDEMAKSFAIYEPLVAKYPQDSVIRQGLLDTYLQGSQLFEDADPARSFEILLKARAVAEKSITADAANVQARQTLAKTYSRLGVIALRLKKTEEAVAYLEKSSLAFSELEKFDPNHRTYKHDVGRVLMYLGQARHQQRAFDAALATYAKATATFEDIARADAGNNLSIRTLATVYQYIGDVHRDVAETVNGETRRAQVQAAKENYTRALDILVRLQGKKALPEYDLKYLGDLRAALLQLERE
jgi:tetratricopeptide (TPR) repeat protein